MPDGRIMGGRKGDGVRGRDGGLEDIAYPVDPNTAFDDQDFAKHTTSLGSMLWFGSVCALIDTLRKLLDGRKACLQGVHTTGQTDGVEVRGYSAIVSMAVWIDGTAVGTFRYVVTHISSLLARLAVGSKTASGWRLGASGCHGREGLEQFP